jgi:hypothetical protein
MIRVSKLGSSIITDVYVLVFMPRRDRKRWTLALPFAAGHREAERSVSIPQANVQQEILLIGAATATALS